MGLTRVTVGAVRSTVRLVVPVVAVSIEIVVLNVPEPLTQEQLAVMFHGVDLVLAAKVSVIQNE